MTSNLPVCPYQSDCASLFIPNHTHYHIHPCPFGSDCTLLHNKKHNSTFKHEKISISKEFARKAKNFFSEIANAIQGIDEENVSLRCPNWDKCKFTNDQDHNSQFYHPCKHGLNCKSLQDDNKENSHKFKFHHPCKYGEKCWKKDPWHRYCFMHGNDEPVWKECHGIVKKPKQIPQAKHQTTYQAHYGNQGNSSSVSTQQAVHPHSVQQVQNPQSLQSIPNNQASQMPSLNYSNNQSYVTPQSQYSQYPYQYNHHPVNHQIIYHPPPKQMIIGSSSETQLQPTINNLSFPPPTILVCSYNILAQCYISASRYSNITNQKYLEWEERKKKIFSILKDRRFDIIGLQEVDNHHVSQIQQFLEQQGFLVYHSYKNHPKKDGLMIAIRNTKFEIFNKGDKTLVEDYPEIFQYVLVRDRVKQRFFCIVNCHLTFQPRDTGPREAQVNEILKQIGKIADPQITSVIWFGDFNTSPHEKPIQLIENCTNVPLQKSHATVENFWSFCGTTGRNSLVDYIWHSPSLIVKESYPTVEFLPTNSIPDSFHGSDHLPLFAEFLY